MHFLTLAGPRRRTRRALLAAALPAAADASVLEVHSNGFVSGYEYRATPRREDGGRTRPPRREIAIRPRANRVTADGDVELARNHSRLTHKGKTVTARLAIRLDDSLAGQTVKAEVEATDTRGRRQLERNAGTVGVAE
jgi:hypothetical protein